MTPHTYHVHCASHNLSLVLKNAMEDVTETRQVYDTIYSVYNYFGHTVVLCGGKSFKNVHDRSCFNSTLKR